MKTLLFSVRVLAALVGVCCAATTMLGQTQEALDNLSLEDVLNMDISVATKKSSTLRESPGIVSLITQEDIFHSGAVDLIDVLRLVPGFDFNQDVPNFLGISVRGNWANEGKVLVMLDGMPLNDLMFGCTAFGNRVQLSLIDRIEIIRGPGSAQYGGMAMLGVINIITKNAHQVNGIRVSANEGRIDGFSGLRNASISSGLSIGDADIILSAYYGSSLRGVGIHHDFDGTEYNMKDYATQTLRGVNLGVSSKSTALRFIIDDYSIGNVDNRISHAYTFRYYSLYADIKNTSNIFSNFSITPRLTLTRQTPWQVDDEQSKDAGLYYNRNIQRTTVGIGFNYDPKENIHVSGGVEYLNDLATTDEAMRETSYFGVDTTMKKTHLMFNTISLYSDILVNSSIANLTIGARYENNTSFYGAFTPRIAITKLIGSFHAKALFSRAFRSPLVENLSLNSSILPEMSNIIELETGYQFSPHLFARVNAFSISIDHPIIFVWDGNFGTYYNDTKSGTYGIEGELQYKTPDFHCTMGYSTYKRTHEDIDTYVTPVNDDRHIGMADYKLTVDARLKLTEGIWLTANQVFFGERCGFTYNSTTKSGQLSCFEPNAIVNACIRMEDIFSTGFDASLIVHNLFNSANYFVGGYNSPSSQVFPIQDLPRLAQFQLQYRFQ